MAGEIAYKLTAEEKQAIDAIRKVAEALSGVEGGVIKVSEETRKAKKEQEEMGRLAKRIMEEAKTPAERYAEQISKIERLYKTGQISMRDYKDALPKAHDEMVAAGNAGQMAFGTKALGAVKSPAGALGIGSALYTALNVIKGEYQAIIDLQDRAKTATLSMADAERTALMNLGPKSVEEQNAFLGDIENMSAKTGVSQKDLFLRTAEALSAKKERPVSEVMNAVEASAVVAPYSPEEGKVLAGAALDIGGYTGATPQQSIGYLLIIGEQAHVTSIGKIAENLAPAMRAAMATGASLQEAGADFAALTQGMNDPEGRKSSTALIQFSTQLEKYLPAEGVRYSEAEYQRDRESLAKERKAAEAKAQRGIQRDPEYLRQLEEIEVERATLRRPTKDPRQAAAAVMRRRELDDQARTALDESEQRSAAGLNSQFTLKEQALTKRREQAKAIVAAGFTTMDQRIAFLQSHPEQRQDFLERSGFEAKAIIPIREILSGQGSTARNRAAFKGELPADVAAGDETFHTYATIPGKAPRQETSRFSRKMVAARESIEASPEMQAKAYMAIIAENFKPILEDVGEYALVAKLKEFDVRMAPDQVQNALKKMQAKQKELRSPTKEYHGLAEPFPGAHYVNWGVGPTYEAPTKEALGLANHLQPVIGALLEVKKALEENSRATKDNTAPNQGSQPQQRSTTGSRRGDPGDRR